MSLIDIFLYRLNNFIELVNIRILQNNLNFDSGDYPDELVALAGIRRNDEVKPITSMKNSVSSATFYPKVANLPIISGILSIFWRIFISTLRWNIKSKRANILKRAMKPQAWKCPRFM